MKIAKNELLGSYETTPDILNLVNPFYPVHPIPFLIFNLCNQ